MLAQAPTPPIAYRSEYCIDRLEGRLLLGCTLVARSNLLTPLHLLQENQDVRY